jgi:DNA-binding NtrC family response regulator
LRPYNGAANVSLGAEIRSKPGIERAGSAVMSESAARVATPSILIVDDDPSTLEGLVELLQRSGYRARGAASFGEGREALDHSTVDLLITDVRLGAANGLQLVLRAQMRQPPTPVIVMTGFADSVLEAEARRMGAVFLLKPVAADDLLALVRNLT